MGTNAAALAVTGDVTIDGELILSTSFGGDLGIGGDLVDNGTFTGNNRAVTFNGTALQTISGTTATTIDFLTINNANNVEVTNALTIGDAFTLTSGQLFVSGAGSVSSSAPAGLTGTTSSATVSGDAGWRMLSVPASSLSTNEIENDGAGLQLGDPSIYTSWNGSAWVAPGSLPTTIDAGDGFIVYFFDNIKAGSTSLELPITIDIDDMTGIDIADDPTVTIANRGAGDLGSNLIGNPHRNAFDIQRLVGTGAPAPQVAQIWNDGVGAGAGGSYISTATIDDQMPVWQSGFIEVAAAGATAVTLLDVAQENGAGTFQGKKARAEKPLVHLMVSGIDAGDALQTRDEAAVLVFASNANDGWDTRDMSKLTPLLSRYATLGFLVDHEDNGMMAPRLKAQDSRGLDLTEALALPMQFDAVGISGAFEIDAKLSAIPVGWDVILEDKHTGTFTDLRTARYAFDADATANAEVNARGSMLAPPPAAVAMKPRAALGKRSAARFVLHVGPGARSVDTEVADGPRVANAITSAYPNPFAERVAIGFALAQPGAASLEVFDLLGRQVLRRDLGALGQGTQSAELDASDWASGVYVARLSVDGAPVATRRLVRVR